MFYHTRDVIDYKFKRTKAFGVRAFLTLVNRVLSKFYHKYELACVRFVFFYERAL